MNSKGLLDALFSAGQQLAQQSGGTLSMPSNNASSGSLFGMDTGDLASSALSLLLGNKSGRQTNGQGLNIGSIAALGGLAFKAYQSWQEHSQQAQASNIKVDDNLRKTLAFEDLDDRQVDARSQKLLQAIIAAAKADAHIDEKEQQTIDAFMDSLGDASELKQFIQSELSKPTDPAEIAKNTEADGLAAQVYLMSKMIINDENFMEKSYLDELAKHLQLDPELIAHLDKQALAQ